MSTLIRLARRLADGDWQCCLCGAWFFGPSSQVCPSCN